MTARIRITIVLALSLVVAGSLALAVHAAAYRGAGYPTWSSYRDELLAEMGVSRQGVVQALDQDPELIFDAPEDDDAFGDGISINSASDTVQQRALDRAAARSMRWAVAAFVVVTVAGTLAAWLLAGRFLRPIRLIADRARVASVDDLGARVSLDGPDDEVKDLADTFDAMLDRLQGSFEAQRRFSAHVAHELRTPLAVSRAEVEMLLDDVTDPSLRSRLANVADATLRADRLVAQLHLLSRTERDDLSHDLFALDEVVGNIVGRVVERPAWRRVHVDLELQPASIVGDRALVESLVRNLVDNAARHNRPGGWVRVAVRSSEDERWAELEVANSVPGDETPADPSTRAHVGLTIVNAVAGAHDGTVNWHTASSEMTAVVRLPAADDSVAERSARALTSA